MRFLRKWILVFFYTAGIIILTPFLPDIIRDASSRWSSSGVSHFVLKVELLIAALVIAFSIFLFCAKKNKSVLLLLSLLGVVLLSFLIYQFLPNPYEFTHLPEYAVLSFLIIRRPDKGEERKNSYLLSGLITGAVGTGDEIYQYFLPNRAFAVYDIFLNILGGIIGLLIFREMKR